MPGQWPDVGAAYQRAGFRHTGHTEMVYLALVAGLPRPEPPVAGLAARRSAGMNGTRRELTRTRRGRTRQDPA